MTAEALPFLVVAITGRPLAQSAARGGYGVVVLDCFGDRDTVAASQACAVVATPGTLHFDPRLVLERAEVLAHPDRCAGLVVGAGFEGRPGLLNRLSAGRELAGNPSRVLRAVKDPRRLFPLFDRLDIPHPDVRLTMPPSPAEWLVKRGGGAGGTHVGFAAREPAGRGSYYQRQESGQPCSVLFLADGQRAFVVGFNEQWTRSVGETRPFVYAGAVGALSLPEPVEQELRSRLDALVGATGLVGLAGLDFLWRGSDWLALEVNPRPTATIDLYDPDYPRGLFAAHLEACAGRLPGGDTGRSLSSVVRAHQIVPAGGAWQLPEEFVFPSWCRDIPPAGTRFAASEPVCTILAEGPDREGTLSLLQSRRQSLEQLMADVVAAG